MTGGLTGFPGFTLTSARWRLSDVVRRRKVSVMEVVPFVVTYNGMATGPCVKRCVEHLMADRQRSFGAAIERVDLYPHCQTREPIIAGLESMRD